MGSKAEGRLLITDMDGTINDYSRRRAACWKAVTGKDYEGNIRKLDIEGSLTTYQYEVYLRLFFSEEGAFTRLDTPLPSAPEILTYFYIARGLRIVYLTGRLSGEDGIGLHDTMNWLTEHKFPVPNNREVYLFNRNNPEKDDLQSKRDDMEHVLELGNPAVGIGDKPCNAIIYVEHGIRVLSFIHPRWEDPDKITEYPPETIFVRDWQEIKRKVGEFL